MLPDGFAVFTFDINGLKTVNDNLGHDAGDELICGAARCIEFTFHKMGRCYRTGGDEFVVLADNMNHDRAKEALVLLARETKHWIGDIVFHLALSAGYALIHDYPGLSAEEMVREADMAMYKEKAAYYRQAGRDRRRR